MVVLGGAGAWWAFSERAGEIRADRALTGLDGVDRIDTDDADRTTVVMNDDAAAGEVAAVLEAAADDDRRPAVRLGQAVASDRSLDADAVAEQMVRLAPLDTGTTVSRDTVEAYTEEGQAPAVALELVAALVSDDGWPDGLVTIAVAAPSDDGGVGTRTSVERSVVPKERLLALLDSAARLAEHGPHLTVPADPDRVSLMLSTDSPDDLVPTWSAVNAAFGDAQVDVRLRVPTGGSDPVQVFGTSGGDVGDAADTVEALRSAGAGRLDVRADGTYAAVTVDEPTAAATVVRAAESALPADGTLRLVTRGATLYAGTADVRRMLPAAAALADRGYTVDFGVLTERSGIPRLTVRGSEGREDYSADDVRALRWPGTAQVELPAATEPCRVSLVSTATGRGSQAEGERCEPDEVTALVGEWNRTAS